MVIVSKPTHLAMWYGFVELLDRPKGAGATYIK